MAGAALSIKLRCASWQQLATIYKRDLSRGLMFLKATTQPPLGTIVRIDLELPSGSVLELQGTIVKHVLAPQRGTGVDLKLEPLPTKSVWMIESALAAESSVASARAARAGTSTRAPTGGDAAQARPAELSEGAELTAAEAALMRALEAELDSLRKLNPFLVLGVGYEASDSDVRHAFGELTKRYHPDRFARYQSVRLRQTAAEIFILIRDAYRRLADERGRQQVLATLKRVPGRPQSEPRAPVPVRQVTGPVRVPQRPVEAVIPPATPPSPSANPHDAPTGASPLAPGDRARNDLAIPVENPRARAFEPTRPLTPATGAPVAPPRRPTTGPLPEPIDISAQEALVEAGKLDEALAQFKLLAKKHPQDRGVRAGIELCEGLMALAARDRLEAAQRFEAALELDPSNERAARELAEMRRQATNERKGLLSRLMGKKEPP